MRTERVVVCRNCGRQNPADFMFCGGCGQHLPEEPPPADVEAPAARSDEQVSSSVVSGPSFLGLESPAPSNDEVSYLLDDQSGRDPYARSSLFWY
jgi:hypothetical protein